MSWKPARPTRQPAESRREQDSYCAPSQPPGAACTPGAICSSDFQLSSGSVEIRDVTAEDGGRICLWAVVHLEALAAHRSSWKPLTSARGAVYAFERVHIDGGRLKVHNASAAYRGGAALWKRSSRRRCFRGNLILLGHLSRKPGAQSAHGTKSFAAVKDSARLSRLQFGQRPSAKSLSSRDTVALIAWAKTPGLGSTSFLPQFMSRGARLRGTRAAKRPCRAQAAKFGFN